MSTRNGGKKKILPADEVCACLDETGERQVRIFERCERCHALTESDLPEQLDAAEREAKRWKMKERAMTDYFADASRRADALGCRLVEMEKYADLYEAEYVDNRAMQQEADELEAELAEANGERSLATVRAEAAEARVAELEAALYAAPQPEAVRNWHTDGEYHARYERTRRARSIEREIAREAEADNRAMQQELASRVAELEMVHGRWCADYPHLMTALRQGCPSLLLPEGGNMNSWDEAVAVFEVFRVEWFETPGGLRSDGVRLAFAADDALEALPRDVFDANQEQYKVMLEMLKSVPDIEKRWFG